MKKIISLILISALLIVTAIPVFAADDKIRVLVTSDVHYVESPVPKGGSTYDDHGTLGLMTSLSKGILDAFLKQAAESDADYVFIPGDLCDTPAAADAAALAFRLFDFEMATGKSVFVINGNHDIVASGTVPDGKIGTAGFKSVYADFGYSEAKAVDEDTCSYVVDLKNGYRLIAIDSLSRSGSGGALSDSLVSWIDTQAKQAKSDGVKLIAMMHHSLLEHFTAQSKLAPGYVVDDFTDLRTKFAGWGIAYVFTGHFHADDIAVYSNRTQDVYDVETTSLSAYPCKYREVIFGSDKVSFSTRSIDSISPEFIPESYGVARRALVESNFPQYSRGCFNDGVKKLARSYMSVDRINGLLKFDEESDEYADLDMMLSQLSVSFDMPIYKTDGAISVEDLATDVGFSLEPSDYSSFGELISAFAAAHMEGDENFDASSLEFRLLFKCVLAIIGTQPEATMDSIIAATFKAMGIGGAEAVVKYSNILVLLKNMDSLGTSYTKSFNKILVGITIDKEPADNTVDLPAYPSSDDSSGIGLSFDIGGFFSKILEFIKHIYEIFRSFIGAK